MYILKYRNTINKLIFLTKIKLKLINNKHMVCHIHTLNVMIHCLFIDMTDCSLNKSVV